MKTLLRIYLNHCNHNGLYELTEKVVTAPVKDHQAIVARIRQLLNEHPIFGRFTDQEVKFGDFTYRNPVWIEIEDGDFDILGYGGICRDRRITGANDLIAFYAMRHYFNVPTGQTVKLGHASGYVEKILGVPVDPTCHDAVGWFISYDPTRDNPFRYRLDIECHDLKYLSQVAMKIVACDKIVSG